MKLLRWMLSCIVLAGFTSRCEAAVTFTTTHGENAHDLDAMMSNSDVLHGLIAMELPGDLGWHPANTNPNDQLPAFTDGVGATGGVTGLLNDFPTLGMPAKLVQYDLAGPTSIQTINIFTGNMNNADGRIFSTTAIRYSTNNGDNFELLGYFQSDPSGSLNNESGIPGVSENHATLVSIFDDVAETMVAGVTNLQFDFYSVDNTGGQMRDPFDGENPFTGLDDGLTAAFVSPLVWEIDVIGQAGAAANADFDGDGDVDGDDFLTWQRGLGTTGNATRQQGDSNGDQNVDALDLENWRIQFGTGGSISAVPEPATGAGLGLGMIACLRVRRRGRGEAAWRRAKDGWRM